MSCLFCYANADLPAEVQEPKPANVPWLQRTLTAFAGYRTVPVIPAGMTVVIKSGKVDVKPIVKQGKSCVTPTDHVPRFTYDKCNSVYVYPRRKKSFGYR